MPQEVKSMPDNTPLYKQYDVDDTKDGGGDRDRPLPAGRDSRRDREQGRREAPGGGERRGGRSRSRSPPRGDRRGGREGSDGGAEAARDGGQPPADATESKPGFDLRSKLRRDNRGEGSATVIHEPLDDEAQQNAGEQTSTPRKKMNDRLGQRKAMTEAAAKIDLRGREFSGVCTGFMPTYCWVKVDGSPDETVFMAFGDLPPNFTVEDGTQVCFNIVPGRKPGDTKAGNIFVHKPGKGQRTTKQPPPKANKAVAAAAEGTTEGDAAVTEGGDEAGDAAATEKPEAKKGTKRKQVVLSLDPQEEERRRKRAERFGVAYKPLEE